MTTTAKKRTNARSPIPPSDNAERALARLRASITNASADAFVARSASAVAKLVESIETETLTRASGAPTDREVLLQALASPSSLAEMEDPLAAARLRGIRFRDELLQAEGGVASAQEVAERLRISRQAVDKRRKAGKLIGLSLGRRGYVYPRWQFDQDGVLFGLETVLQALAEWDPWMKVSFMLNPNLRLEDSTPLQALRAGQVLEAELAADAFGEHGAA